MSSTSCHRLEATPCLVLELYSSCSRELHNGLHLKLWVKNPRSHPRPTINSLKTTLAI
ncbi:hypothetical protein M405DRAFT_806745 [Rhizopogon salebrosus TDB-379]|nr:hypothetical protein M405DRAFT_806745 [Rhizopogon salebrosus TDB-379]